MSTTAIAASYAATNTALIAAMSASGIGSVCHMAINPAVELGLKLVFIAFLLGGIYGLLVYRESGSMSWADKIYMGVLFSSGAAFVVLGALLIISGLVWVFF